MKKFYPPAPMSDPMENEDRIQIFRRIIGLSLFSSFQAMKQFNVDLKELAEKAEAEEKQAAYYQELWEKSKTSKKEMQRLRSSLGEAESKLERLEKDKERLER